jgi:putative flippase GtrA
MINNPETNIEKIDKKEGLWQFIKFTLVSLITTVVELTTFTLFNYLIFSSLSLISFKLWLLDYSIENGGLRTFLAFSLSFIIAQIFNFFVQRKATFKADNKVLNSALMYIVMILIIFILQLWLPTMIRIPLSRLTGQNWADFIIKNMMMTLAFVIQFPINKWIIMKKKN